MQPVQTNSTTLFPRETEISLFDRIYDFVCQFFLFLFSFCQDNPPPIERPTTPQISHSERVTQLAKRIEEFKTTWVPPFPENSKDPLGEEVIRGWQGEKTIVYPAHFERTHMEAYELKQDAWVEHVRALGGLFERVYKKQVQENYTLTEETVNREIRSDPVWRAYTLFVIDSENSTDLQFSLVADKICHLKKDIIDLYQLP